MNTLKQLTKINPIIMQCMLCDAPATVRVSIQDGPAVVKVVLCDHCASMPADDILYPRFLTPRQRTES